MFSVAVIGPAAVRRDGVAVRLRPGKDTELLVRLAVEPGRSVRADLLLQELWGEEDSPRRNTLQAKVSSLRRAAGEHAFVVAGPTGYSLGVEPAHLDIAELERLTRILDAGRADRDPAGAVEVSGRLLALFDGEILPGAGDGAWALPYRARLAEVRLLAAEDHWTARLDLGDAPAAIAPLQALVVEFPLRERLWGILITALARSGRHADALAACRRARRALRDEAGLDPGPELLAVERAVLQQDVSLDAAVRFGAAPGPSTQLVGRADDVRSVVTLLDGARLVSVVGPAGVGKTAVAMHVVAAAGDGRASCFVRLDLAAPGTPVLDTVAGAFGIPGTTVTRLGQRIAGRSVLLVLDNCEHVLDEAAKVVTDLLDAAPDLRVLATSRVPLGIAAERVHPLGPLGSADAVELFRQRAHSRRGGWSAADWDSEAAQLCRALDGLPLAIELAAARTRMLSLPDISRRLSDRFALLSDPIGRRPDRHRTLEAAIRWSYDLLFPDEQRGLWALGCFAGGATIDGFEDVLAALDVPRSAALDIATRLADRSLLVVDEATQPPGPGAPATRLRLLDSVRDFARGELEASGCSDEALGAHASRLAEAADAAAAGLRGPRQADHLAIAVASRSDIDAALNWTVEHDPPMALRIASGFGWAWMISGDGAAGSRRLRRVLDSAPGADARSRAIAWGVLGWLETSDNLDAAEAATQRSIDLADELGDRALGAWARIARAFTLSQRAAHGELLEFLASWQRTYGDLEGSWESGVAWILTAHAALMVGDLDRARTAGAAALAIVPLIGDDWGIGHLESLLGVLARSEHRFDRAADHFADAAASAHRLGFVATEGYHLSNLGRALHQDGQDDDAAAVLRQAVEIGRASGELRVAALAQTRLGWVLRTLGEDVAARAELAVASAWFIRTAGGEGSALAACLLAAVDATAGLPGAVDRLRALLATAEQSGDGEVEVLACDAIARHNADTGALSAAREWLARGDVRFPAAAHLLVDRDRVDAARVREMSLGAADR